MPEDLFPKEVDRDVRGLKSAPEAAAEQAANKMLEESRQDLLSDRNIVRKDARSEKFCPDSTDGDVCKMTQKDAEKYCEEQGGHLPSTRDFAKSMNPDAILEKDYVEQKLNGVAPPGFYKVDSQDKDGNLDSFYFNNSMATRKLTGEVSQLSFWTSSFVHGNPSYAHVFYGSLGGGGGTKEDHHLSVKHAVLFVDTKLNAKK